MVLLLACSKKEETICQPKPNIIEINIVNKLDNQNVFTTGTFSKNQLSILTNPANQFAINFNQYSSNTDIFRIEPIRIVGNINFSIILNNQITIPLTAKIIKNTACGEFYYFENIISNDSNYELELVVNNLKIKN